MTKILSIDPSGNGATAFVEANYDLGNDEPITLTNFGVLDFGQGEETNYEKLRNKRAKLLENFVEFIIESKPDLVILENFIQYRVQMGNFGQSFPTAEMIGVLDYLLRKNNIPLVRVRASSLRIPRNDYYERVNKETGVLEKIPKPRKFKENLRNPALKKRGFLVARRYNRTHIVVNGEEYCLSNYKVGTKNDHVIMALRHLVNWLETHEVFKELRRLEIGREIEND